MRYDKGVPVDVWIVLELEYTQPNRPTRYQVLAGWRELGTWRLSSWVSAIDIEGDLIIFDTKSGNRYVGDVRELKFSDVTINVYKELLDRIAQGKTRFKSIKAISNLGAIRHLQDKLRTTRGGGR